MMQPDRIGYRMETELLLRLCCSDHCLSGCYRSFQGSFGAAELRRYPRRLELLLQLQVQQPQLELPLDRLLASWQRAGRFEGKV